MSTSTADKLAAALIENEEQARLLGMSAERECALRAKVERLEREVDELKAALALGQENCDAEYDCLREERDEAVKQARLLGASAERECDLRGKVERLERELTRRALLGDGAGGAK